MVGGGAGRSASKNERIAGVGNEFAAGHSRQQKTRLFKPRFLQQEKRRGKMKKGENQIYIKHLSPVPLLGRCIISVICFVWPYYSLILLTKKVGKY